MADQNTTPPHTGGTLTFYAANWSEEAFERNQVRPYSL
jgi:hypothetical protein